jgi:uncharacterized protein YfaT (DUF1175 family)
MLLSMLPIRAIAECPKQTKTEQALVELEHRWAKALEQRDSSVIDCILAPEFTDSSATGQLYARQQVLGALPTRKASFNHLQELHATVLGDAGMVRGVNRVTDAAGHELARVRFTDVFAYRDGRWQAIAGQETLVQEKAPQGKTKP